MNAPSVPMRLGKGMKYGRLASRPYRMQAKKWPISWAIRIAISVREKARPLSQAPGSESSVR